MIYVKNFPWPMPGQHVEFSLSVEGDPVKDRREPSAVAGTYVDAVGTREGDVVGHLISVTGEVEQEDGTSLEVPMRMFVRHDSVAFMAWPAPDPAAEDDE